LISGQDGEDALVGLANGADFAAGIGSKAIGGGARVARGFSDHIGLDGIEGGEFVGETTLAGIAAEDDPLLQEQHGFLRGVGNDIDAISAHRDLLVDDVAMRCPLAATVFVGLRVDDANYASLNFVGLDGLLLKKIQDNFFVGFGFGVDGGEIIAGFFVVERPDGEVGFYVALDQAFYGDVTIGQTGVFDLDAEDPAAEDQA